MFLINEVYLLPTKSKDQFQIACWKIIKCRNKDINITKYDLYITMKIKYLHYSHRKLHLIPTIERISYTKPIGAANSACQSKGMASAAERTKETTVPNYCS